MFFAVCGVLLLAGGALFWQKFAAARILPHSQETKTSAAPAQKTQDNAMAAADASETARLAAEAKAAAQTNMEEDEAREEEEAPLDAAANASLSASAREKEWMKEDEDAFLPSAGAAGLRVIPGTAPALEKQDARLIRAWAACRAGDFAAAHPFFAALSEDQAAAAAALAEALLALAVMARRQNHLAEARRFYHAAHKIAPKDTRTAAEYIAFLGETGAILPKEWEERLRELTRREPEAAAARFALGRFYSRQARWSDAEQEFFAALEQDANQPDILFNLAVSLDALGETAAAAQYYQAALAAAKNAPAVFAPEAAWQRLEALRGGT